MTKILISGVDLGGRERVGPARAVEGVREHVIGLLSREEQGVFERVITHLREADG